MFKKSFIYIIGQGLAAIIAIILIPLYTKYLSPSEYGYATIIQITFVYSSTLLSFGLNTGFMIRYWKTNEEQRKKMFTIVLLFYCIVPFIFLLISPFYRFLEPIMGAGFNLFYFWLLGLTIFSALYFNFYTALLRNQLKPALYVFFSIGNALVMALLNIFFIVEKHMGYWSFFYSMFFSFFIFAVIGTFYYRNYFVTLNLKVDKRELLSLLKISSPILPTQAATGVLVSADRYILKHIESDSAVGIYSIGNKFGSLIRSFFVDPFFAYYIPIALELYIKNLSEFKELQKRYLILTTLFFVTITIVLSIFFEFFFKFFINQRFWDGYPIIGVVLLGYFFISIPYIVTIVQTIHEKLQYSMWINIFAAIINICLNFVFISLWGYMGAALTFMLSYFLVMISTIYINQRLLHIDYNWLRIFVIVVIGIVTILLEHLVNIETFEVNILVKLFWASIGLLILYIYNKDIFSPMFEIIYRKIKLIKQRKI